MVKNRRNIIHGRSRIPILLPLILYHVAKQGHGQFFRRGLTHLDAPLSFKNRSKTYMSPCKFQLIPEQGNRNHERLFIRIINVTRKCIESIGQEVGDGGSDTSEVGGSIFSLVDFWCLYCLKLLWIFLAAQFSISSSLTASATEKISFDDFFVVQ